MVPLAKILTAVPLIVLMLGFAKAAKYAAVDAFGHRLGFNLASLIGLVPVISAYWFAGARLSAFAKGARSQ